MRNVDPYNNMPPPRNNPGQAPKNMNEQYNYQQQQSPQQQQSQQLNPQTENFMLRSDLQTAIQYIYQLGGVWPPPGK